MQKIPLEKLNTQDSQSLDIKAENIAKLKALFPEILSEKGIDFDVLKQLLGEELEEAEERYSFTWNGKARARRLAQTPSTGTLRPCKEESKDWDSTQNLFIEGDNLEVLKLLQKSYHQKVKMIYIDPPYNTGKDFIYPDNFRDNIKNYLELTGQTDAAGKKLSINSETSGRYHTEWMNMMYPRLKLAKNLLSPDGLIFISIDDCEVSNLRKICDEIFGEENFIDSIIWKKRYGGGAKEKYLVSVHEYALVFAKSINDLPEIVIPTSQETIDRYYKTKDSNYSIRGAYRTHPLEATKSMGERKNLVFPIACPDGTTTMPKRQWLWSKERVADALEKNEIEFIKDKDGGWSVHSKQYLKDENGDVRGSKSFSLIDDIYTQHGTNEIIDLFGDAHTFSFPKPSGLIKKFLDIGADGNQSIVLDFFSGSATTAHAILQKNVDDSKTRKYILVQLPEPTENSQYRTIADIGKERIRRAGEKILVDNAGKSGIENLDVGFKVFKLDSSNIKPWDAGFDTLSDDLLTADEVIKPARGADDVLFEILLKYGLDLSLPVITHTLAEKTVFEVGAGALLVCLDRDITEAVAEAIGKLKAELVPAVCRVVFRDAGFADDAAKVNAVQVLKQFGIDDVKSL